MEKKVVLVMFGGLSSERDVSIASAKNIFSWLDEDRYVGRLVYVDEERKWYVPASWDLLKGKRVAVEEALSLADVAFPVFHGMNGEDGTVQGLLRFMGVPFVGCDVLSSAACLDKEYTKRLLKEAGLPVGRFIAVQKQEKERYSFSLLAEKLGVPFFVKPARAGSSIGVAKIYTEEQFVQGYERAFMYDQKVLVEECTAGRDIECAVIGNEEKKASLVGEVVCEDGFYSYEAKCIDTSRASLSFPAQIPSYVAEKVRSLSIAVTEALGCEGMARVDFLLTPEGNLFVNEVNTIPGCTEISLFPKLWEISGLTPRALMSTLIDFALERASKERKTVGCDSIQIAKKDLRDIYERIS